jgi:hypothetical protein
MTQNGIDTLTVDRETLRLAYEQIEFQEPPVDGKRVSKFY